MNQSKISGTIHEKIVNIQQLMILIGKTASLRKLIKHCLNRTRLDTIFKKGGGGGGEKKKGEREIQTDRQRVCVFVLKGESTSFKNVSRLMYSSGFTVL